MTHGFCGFNGALISKLGVVEQYVGASPFQLEMKLKLLGTAFGSRRGIQHWFQSRPTDVHVVSKIESGGFLWHPWRDIMPAA